MNRRRNPQAIYVYENETPVLYARVWDEHPADYLVQSTTEAIYWYVYDEAGVLVTTLPYDSTDLIFDTLQTDSAWTYDSTGYNFKHRFPSGVFTTGAKRYRVEYRFVIYDAGSDAEIRELAHVFDVHVKALKSA